MTAAADDGERAGAGAGFGVGGGAGAGAREPRGPGWFARLGLRGRLLVSSLLAVALALLIGGVLLYVLLTTSISRTVQGEVLSIARDVALLIDSGRLPEPVPVAGAQVVQVLDGQGRVVGASVTADRLTPLVSEDERHRAVAGETVIVPGNRTGLAGRLQVAAVEAGPDTARVTVVAATPTADLETSGSTLRLLLLILFPLLLGALAVIAWRLIGAALRPVEELRLGATRVDESSSDTERLPVPPARDEVRALALTLNAMLDRVASARRTQRAFVADAAHELRSPLASLRTQLEVAERLGEGGPLVTDLLADVQRLSSLAEDLLLLARADDAAPPTERSAVALEPLLAEVVSRYAGAAVPVRLETGTGVPTPRPRAGTRGARSVSRGARAGGARAGGARAVAADADSELVVEAARADLARALTNLLDNAVRHAATRVTVTAETVGRRVEVSVTDDGHGIRLEDRERVFDRFTRLDEARDRDRERGGGTGLGLAITRELMRRGQATVRLEDADPGLRAVLNLPAADLR